MARETGVYHLVDNPAASQSSGPHAVHGAERVERGPYSATKISDEINNIKREEQVISRELSTHSIQSVTVNYENAVETREYLHQIADFAGMSGIRFGPRNFKKVGGSVSEQWISRFKRENEQRDD